MVSNFCSTFSWYGKCRPTDLETGPQPFIISYQDSKDLDFKMSKPHNVLELKLCLLSKEERLKKKRRRKDNIFQGKEARGGRGGAGLAAGGDAA